MSGVAIQGFSLLSLFGTAASNSGQPSLGTILGNSFRHYSFATAPNGRVILPTSADLDKASNPKDKLTVAGQLAEVLQVQSDAAIKTGLPNRIAKMTADAKSIMDVVGTIVGNLANAPASTGAGAPDPLKPYQQSLSAVLGTLHSVISQISALVPKATPSVAAATTAAVRLLDLRGGALAKQAGLVWPALTAAGASAAAPAATATPTTNNLVNIIA
jgi:hypothetical protein